MIVIVGESGSGKSTLQKMLIEREPDKFKKLVTYTTRPQRPHEANGYDYHFVTSERFLQMERENIFCEKNSYRGWMYGTSWEGLGDYNMVAVLTPAGLRDMKRNEVAVFAVYLKVDRESRMKKLIDRGDNIDEAYRRNLSDVGQFDGIEREVDAVINNYGFRMSKEEVMRNFLNLEYIQNNFNGLDRYRK